MQNFQQKLTTHNAAVFSHNDPPHYDYNHGLGCTRDSGIYHAGLEGMNQHTGPNLDQIDASSTLNHPSTDSKDFKHTNNVYFPKQGLNLIDYVAIWAIVLNVMLVAGFVWFGRKRRARTTILRPDLNGSTNRFSETTPDTSVDLPPSYSSVTIDGTKPRSATNETMPNRATQKPNERTAHSHMTLSGSPPSYRFI